MSGGTRMAIGARASWRWPAAALGLATLPGGGCSDGPSAPVSAVLELTYEGPATRVVGVEFCIEAKVFRPEGGALEVQVEWGSTAAAVARVDEAGCVLPEAVGEVGIWAQALGTDAVDTLEFVVVAPASLELETEWPGQVVGRQRAIEARVRDVEGGAVEGLELHWTSNDLGIARVDGEGVVRAVAPGDVVIRAVEPQSGLRDSLSFHSAAPGEAKWKWAVPEECSGLAVDGCFGTSGGVSRAPDGRLFVSRFSPNLTDGVLHALDSNGGELWSLPLPSVWNNVPTVSADGQVVYLVGGEATFAVTREGEVLWSVESVGEPSGSFNYSALSGDGSRVYAANGTQLRAHDASSGEILWASAVDPQGAYLVPPTISPDGSRVYAKLSDRDLQAFDAATGELIWSVPDPTGSVDPAVFNNGAVWADGRLFVPLRDRLAEVDPKDGTVLWESEAGGNGWSESAVGPDGSLYLGTGAGGAAWVPGSNRIWLNRDVYPAPAWNGAPALAADGTLYFVSFDGFYALAAADGAVKWRYPADEAQEIQFYGAPLIDPAGIVYTFTADTLYAFWEDSPPEPDSPWPMWRHDARRSGQAHR